MRLILEDIHGNSKVADLGGWYWGKRVTICPRTYSEGREHFTELHNFFTQSLGPSFDVSTLEILHPRPSVKWAFQIANDGKQHRFFIKNAEDLTWFQLKYSQYLTKWS